MIETQKVLFLSQDKINIKNLVCVLLPQHDLTFSTKSIYYLTKLIYDQVCKLEPKKKKGLQVRAMTSLTWATAETKLFSLFFLFLFLFDNHCLVIFACP